MAANSIKTPKNNASKESPTRAPFEEDQDDMPLIGERETDKILQTFNSRFDAVEQTTKCSERTSGEN